MSQRIIPIIIIFFLILLVVGGYFLWWPKYQEFKSKNAEVAGRDEEIKQKQERLSGLEDISAKLSEYASEIAKINSALPTDSSITAMFNFIQKKASENGLILSNIDMGGIYSSKAGEERIQKMPFSISVSGSYPSLKNFLSSLYKNSSLVKVKSISFSSPPKEKGESLFIFNLDIETRAYNY